MPKSENFYLKSTGRSRRGRANSGRTGRYAGFGHGHRHNTPHLTGNSDHLPALLKTRAVFDLRDQHRLPVLLTVAGLAASKYHYWRITFDTHGPVAPDWRVAAIRAVLIQQRKHHYGWRRGRAELQVIGMFLSDKTANRLMREHGLQSPVRAKRYNSYRGDDAAAHPVVPNVDDRGLQSLSAQPVVVDRRHRVPPGRS